MTNQEIDEQFDKQFTYLTDTDMSGYAVNMCEEVKAFIHKVIAERDEALFNSKKGDTVYIHNRDGTTQTWKLTDISSLLE